MGNQEYKLNFFITPEHACNYLDKDGASSLFADPLFPKSKKLYTALVNSGFRRSGEHLYKPYCSACTECVPVRIPVNEFKLRRHQKRTWNKNQDLTVTVRQADYQEAHFQLYKKYLSQRHSGGGMDNPTEENYSDFLWAAWSDTFLFEFRLKDQLIAVSVVDQLDNGFSAVYSFYDTFLSNRSLGKYMILYLIEHTKGLGLSWLYLGYWIADCKKMKYKTEYQPIEYYIDEEWKKSSTLASNDFSARQN